MTGIRDAASGGGVPVAERVAAVVVDYDAGPVLDACLGSLAADGVGHIVVVENGRSVPAPTVRRLPDAGRRAQVRSRVPVVLTGRNVGFGAGANRGLAASAGGVDGMATDYVLVCNPDLHVHRGAVAAMAAALDAEPAWAIVGPRILTPEGEPYPSARQFPDVVDAAGHALVGLFRPDNPFTRRYRSPAPGPAPGARTPADWVSGSCMLVRRSAFEELGGFDEAYFMFAEDMDLCWRAHRAGWGVGFVPDATVTHVQGVSTRRHPYRMLVAHHRSAWRFAQRTTRGWRRALLPFGWLVLAVRLVLALAKQGLEVGPPPD